MIEMFSQSVRRGLPIVRNTNISWQNKNIISIKYKKPRIKQLLVSC